MSTPQVFEVSPSIWCVRRPSYFTCSYIVKTASGVVLIDAGMDSAGQDMFYALEQIGFPSQGVQAIFLTHWHNDHAAGGEALRRSTNAPVYYHLSDTPYLTRETARKGLRGWLSDLIPELGPLVLFKGLLGEATPHAVSATRFVEDGELLLSDFEVIATPGHTSGHLSLYYRPERALFAGDALAVVGGRVRFMARPVTEDVSLARQSMLRCLSREIDLLCPGHREPLTSDTRRHCREMAQYIERGGGWPLLG